VVALVMAMTGHGRATEDLAGDGVALLLERSQALTVQDISAAQRGRDG
jgi:hypothetical protein